MFSFKPYIYLRDAICAYIRTFAIEPGISNYIDRRTFVVRVKTRKCGMQQAGESEQVGRQKAKKNEKCHHRHISIIQQHKKGAAAMRARCFSAYSFHCSTVHIIIVNKCFLKVVAGFHGSPFVVNIFLALLNRVKFLHID